MPLPRVLKFVAPPALVVFAIAVLMHRGRPSAAASATSQRQHAPAREMTPGIPAPLPLPLPVSMGSATHQWTGADAMDPRVIEKIAHNPDEFIKMVEENDRILRRQLVYRKDTAASVVQRARLAGEPVRRLTLPALDGREVEFEVTTADLSPSGQSGSFTGHVAGKPASLVTLAFEFGTEAFSVMSPDDQLFLIADPREPGQVIVKSIDPDKYQPLPCGNPAQASR